MEDYFVGDVTANTMILENTTDGTNGDILISYVVVPKGYIQTFLEDYEKDYMDYYELWGESVEFSEEPVPYQTSHGVIEVHSHSGDYANVYYGFLELEDMCVWISVNDYVHALDNPETYFQDAADMIQVITPEDLR